jgi:hypothetical protein
MTLHATREGENITVHATYGPMSFKITEAAAHIGQFWHQLDGLLRDNEKPWLKTEPVPGVAIDADGTGRAVPGWPGD